MSDAIISPLNDFTITVPIFDIDPVTFQPVPATMGTARMFFGNVLSSTAGPAHVSLDVNGSHIADGVWGFSIDASVQTAAVMNAAFATGKKVYVYVERTGAIRVVRVFPYRDTREAEAGT